eukprot:COSAG05_NODE_14294_length_401_cov_1.175497_1_plen_75_part_10
MTGGKRPDSDRCNGYTNGYFWEPTVLGDVSPEMSCFQDEIFGPVCHMIILGLKAIDGKTRGRAHERRDCHSSSYK